MGDPWEQIADEHGQLMWHHRENGMRIPIGTSAAKGMGSQKQAPRALFAAQQRDDDDKLGKQLRATFVSEAVLTPHATTAARRPSAKQAPSQPTISAAPPPAPKVPPAAEIGAMDCGALCMWLARSGAASAASLARLRAHAVDGAALLALATDPFCPGGLRALGLEEELLLVGGGTLPLREQLLAAVAAGRRSASATAAAEWKRQRSEDAATSAAAAAAPAVLPGTSSSSSSSSSSSAEEPSSLARGARPEPQLTAEEEAHRAEVGARRARRAARRRRDGPAAVQVGYKIDELGEVDCIRSIFFAHFKVFGSWLEPELAGCDLRQAQRVDVAAACERAVRWEQRHGLLQPDLIVRNAHDLMVEQMALKVSDRVEGRVKWSKHFRGWLSLDLGRNLKNFPFDYHDLRVTVACRSALSSEVSLSLWGGVHATEFQVESNEWQLMGHRAEAAEMRVMAEVVDDPAIIHGGAAPAAAGAAAAAASRSLLHICIMVRRFSKWYLYNVFGFLFALVIMSLGVYAMPYIGDEAVSGRTQCCMSLIFAVIGMKFVVADNIPYVFYSTFFDEYVIFSFALTALSGIQSLLMYGFSLGALDEDGGGATFSIFTCDLINVFMAAIVFGLFVSMHVAWFLRLRKHRARMDAWHLTRLPTREEEADGGNPAERRQSPQLSNRRIRRSQSSDAMKLMLEGGAG